MRTSPSDLTQDRERSVRSRLRHTRDVVFEAGANSAPEFICGEREAKLTGYIEGVIEQKRRAPTETHTSQYGLRCRSRRVLVQ